MVKMKNDALLSYFTDISDKFNELHISLNGPNKNIFSDMAKFRNS
jgi:vacuolar-type H+-ATPase subunit D/Vma8